MTRQTDFLIIGGGAAGTTAAGVIRTLNPNAKITILSGENYRLYSRVLLPNYIRGEITREQLFLKNPMWYRENQIELVGNSKAAKLIPDQKKVELANGETFLYKKLLIATGASPIRLNVPGADLENISYMWTIGDADTIIEAAKTAKRGVIIGGGFIGLEFAHSFKEKGIETVILEGAPYYWGTRLDEKSSRVLRNLLEANGIKVVAGDQVQEFEGRTLKRVVGTVKTKSGKKYEADLVGIGIGIRNDLEWLNDSGMKIDGGIVTNEYLETSIPDVYAAGDCVSFYDLIIQVPHIVGTWGNATTQGAVVAKTMCDVRTAFEAVSAYTINFFGSSCSFIGMTEEDFVDEIVVRGSVEDSKITRIFVKKYNSQTRIVGATVINNPAEVSPLTTAVKNRVDIASHKDRLSDLSFDLKQLIG
ncbi:hypothetical protein A2697_04765 [Candidatus Curtissbacteria bacterium RIFCSPHIGHO2_01_FULL_41_44]|uniref:FAD/NAD(P)-binding domain-containing protein n=1 Tax=Candidatus Curtissbacteria bacterium RIFCSPLOWO2_01_FULL_42_50 TaxID=1797730 RepID=A0A1F5H6L4_9BACT|nr:MAG: hypothetical protein A3C33_03920 [Candidatus Curtissbacteria bacterium RIFCSPHIGHO2_02_FULL_42_58]OGD94333.1 MAG: hypothetical protein A2697_04765 [Candidatus Curtissbacteria bacterium RIFCSPHIGHO2_01_FULL_41_44]OGD97235.1 MAG: hypothetical protein A3E71_04205 [Candidatus Curtissbacteria bacterium RIFCSPHIGHO2_12_FULL_42_33]OGD99718.1 MAG: hypothetical protein A3B54_05595 [Candidatus Curtissbacteria bacterium RIFCSPLOWO2_01_FULL_42_50]OGE02357.1 MAG: hypothetical protein A3G16_03980 [Ca